MHVGGGTTPQWSERPGWAGVAAALQAILFGVIVRGLLAYWIIVVCAGGETVAMMDEKKLRTRPHLVLAWTA